MKVKLVLALALVGVLLALAASSVLAQGGPPGDMRAQICANAGNKPPFCPYP